MKWSRDTAPGADMITYSMLHHARDAGHKALLQVINASWTAQKLPLEWNKTGIQPIPKRREPEKPRPISLLCCIAKTADRMVLQAPVEWRPHGSPYLRLHREHWDSYQHSGDTKHYRQL